MAEAAFAPLGDIQFLYQYQVGLRYLADNHLCDPVPMMDDLWLIAQVDEYYFYFSPVITVDCAGRIKTGNALFNGKPASWPDLRLVPTWQLNR